MNDLLEKSDDDFSDPDTDAALFGPLDDVVRADVGAPVTALGSASRRAAWQRLEQWREERFLRQCLREVYED